jgi:hypothetical protein
MEHSDLHIFYKTVFLSKREASAYIFNIKNLHEIKKGEERHHGCIFAFLKLHSYA